MTTLVRPTLIRTRKRNANSTARIPRLLRAILGVPLEQKVLGANLLILGMALAVLLSPLTEARVTSADTMVIFGALVMGALVSYILISVALKPVTALERIARKVAMGHMSERVPQSLVADPDLAHLAATVNDMLDNIAAGRKRMSTLAAEVVYAQERERAQIARELHDSVGQSLAAANFQIAAAANQDTAAEMRTQLSSARDLLRTSLEDIRNVSRSLHPRVADDLGLPAALQALADRTRERSLVDVTVSVNLKGVEIPPALSATFYRVAQEALRNVEMHADAGNALVYLCVRNGSLELEITDDGCGLDNAPDKATANPVLANMRRRLSLAGGELHIHSMPDCGTRVIARAKLEPAQKGEGEAA